MTADQISPAFRFYAGDYLTDTEWLTPAEEAAYIRLLCHCWRGSAPGCAQGQLPADREILSRLAKNAPAEVIERVVDLLFVHSGDFITHKRLTREMEKQAEYRCTKSEAGKRGAAARWKGGKAMAVPSDGDGKAMANDGSSSSSSSSDSFSPSAEDTQRAAAEPAARARDIQTVMEQPPIDCGVMPHESKRHRVPYDDIHALWTEIIPADKPTPTAPPWGKSRQEAVRARWRAHPDLSWWRALFERAAASKGLMTECKPFAFDWLISERISTRVMEGNYDRWGAPNANGAPRSTEPAGYAGIRAYMRQEGLTGEPTLDASLEVPSE